MAQSSGQAQSPWWSERETRRGVLRGLAGAGAATLASRAARSARAMQNDAGPTPVTGHPRLWLTEADLPRLQARASAANPLWQEGLLLRAEMAVSIMDDGLVPGEDTGGTAWEPYPSENYAAFFAYLSLVHPDLPARAEFAERARTLLMHVMNEAALGPEPGVPFRDPEFSLRDRSRWWGEAFPLTVDWIYPVLSAEDKATIRQVFLRWVDENMNAAITGSFDHPQPVGVVNDPILIADPIAVRWSANNYFTAHMRNIGLMALALDPADDPDGALTGALENATGAWLYMTNYLLLGDSRGGLTPEGFEYSPQAIGYVAQFLLALHTAGRADPAIFGQQVILPDNPFWDELGPAYLHSLSPKPTTVADPDWAWVGPVYLPAWYGDGQRYWGPDFIGVFGPLGWYDDLTGNVSRLEAIRWMQTHLAPGGADLLVPLRTGDGESFLLNILYFMLFDPDAPEPADPRATTSLHHFAPGIGRSFHRTSWEPDAAWFTYALGWNSIDHQHADGNQFEYYRNGEWLTKERTGYGFSIGSSDYHNTLALENNPPDRGDDPTNYPAIVSQRGSQWVYVAAGDPVILARSASEAYAYYLGDATNLYNSEYEQATDILHASRSIVWLPPDHIVVYDRAASLTEGRFKRFWLNLPALANVAGNVSTMTTELGQQLVVTTLLPADAEISSEPAEPLEQDQEPATNEPMQFRLRVEAPGGPSETRFLHLLQGADAGASIDQPILIESVGATFAGVVVTSTAVLFPVGLSTTVEELTYVAPAETRRHLVTGLVPEAQYTVSLLQADGEQQLTIRPGAGVRTDSGGVLVFDAPD